MIAQVMLCLKGCQANAAAAVLTKRLVDLGRPAQVAGAEVSFIPVTPPVSGELRREIVLDANDPPAFAAEKVLDMLASEDLVVLELASGGDEDEALLQDRLKRLGYIE